MSPTVHTEPPKEGLKMGLGSYVPSAMNPCFTQLPCLCSPAQGPAWETLLLSWGQLSLLRFVVPPAIKECEQALR